MFFKRKPKDWLKDYPAYEQPFVAPVGKLKPNESKANLEYLLENKAARKQYLAELLVQFDIDVAKGLAAKSPDELVKDLYRWSGERWLQYFIKGVHAKEQWLVSDRSGKDLIYSVVMDVTILLGDLIIERRPTYSWGIDDDPDNRPMYSYNRCVLLAPRLIEPKHNKVIDIEVIVAGGFLRGDNLIHDLNNNWLRTVTDCTSGRSEGLHLL